MSIGSNSILLDPLQVGRAGPGNHNITYGPNGEKPALHSNSSSFKNAYQADREHMPPLKKREINSEFVAELGNTLLNRADNRDERSRKVASDTRGRRPIEVVQIVLGRVYQVSWLLLREA
jgi:hypothetical protein